MRAIAGRAFVAVVAAPPAAARRGQAGRPGASAAGSTSAGWSRFAASASRRRRARRRAPAAARPTCGAGSSTSTAAPRGAFDEPRTRPRGDGPAQRDLRAAAAGGHDRDGRRLPQQRPHLPQRLLALAGPALRPRPLCRRRSKSVRFDRPGIVRVFCDIHSHMSAFVVVFNHPFFRVTDVDGRFRLDDVPPGTYTVVGWYEGEARLQRSVTVTGRRHGRSRPGGAVIPGLGSLRSRIFVASTLLATASIGAAVYFVSVRLTRRGRSRAAARPDRSRGSGRPAERVAVRELHPHGHPHRRPAQVQGGARDPRRPDHRADRARLPRAGRRRSRRRDRPSRASAWRR